MPRPFVGYLRVYEPLSAFAAPLADRLRARVESHALTRSAVGEREQELWLRSQVAQPARLLPAELADGKAAPNLSLDVLVLQPAEVPTSDTATVGPGPLVCPLDLRPRAAAALAGFLSTAAGPLRSEALQDDAERARSHATEVMAADGAASVHVISATWSLPLPWFAIVDPEDRHVLLSNGDQPVREVYWRCAMADARRRVARAYAVTRDTVGEDGPAAVLRETGRWLERFHAHSAVELDYGGLVQLMTDEELLEDTSAQDVWAIVKAMEDDDADAMNTHFAKVRDFWAHLAAKERLN
ncbi:MAG TPA: hypothetical protein VFW65_15390 [Pseudonocardiaceae bacterium]|nr:hypothetical protein [Pseudonocardiaceae bacterium]